MLLSLVALYLCPLATLTRLTLMLITSIGALLNYLPTRQKQTLAWCDDETWQFDDRGTTLRGATATGSYRSMLLIVVAIKPEQGQSGHAVIWRDAVSPEIFSALHVRLALTQAHQLQ